MSIDEKIDKNIKTIDGKCDYKVKYNCISCDGYDTTCGVYYNEVADKASQYSLQSKETQDFFKRQKEKAKEIDTTQRIDGHA